MPSAPKHRHFKPNRTLRRDLYADATIDLAHDSRSIILLTLTLSNFQSPHTLDLYEPLREEEERDRMRYWAGYS